MCSAHAGFTPQVSFAIAVAFAYDWCQLVAFVIVHLFMRHIKICPDSDDSLTMLPFLELVVWIHDLDSA